LVHLLRQADETFPTCSIPEVAHGGEGLAEYGYSVAGGRVALPARHRGASLGHAEFNGRALADDVKDVILSLRANSELGDGVAPDSARIQADFPYLGRTS
jgi:hypothetical protein